MRPCFLVACSASLLLSAPAALAENHVPALVRLLHTPGRVHPLADASGRIPVTASLPPGSSAANLGLLEVAPGVGAIRLPPEEVAYFAATHPSLALSVTPHLRPLLDFSGSWTHVAQFRQATGGLRGRGVIVGIVDTGLDVRHPDFRTKDGHTRVAWMLAATPPAGIHPDLEDRFGCTDPNQSPCAIYSAADIDQMLQAGTSDLHDSEGHGTHVTSIAAGNGGPSVTTNPRYVGMAPEATLIFAAPPLTGGEASLCSGSGATPGGFVDADILNAARFVFDRADAMGLPAGCEGDTCVPQDCPRGDCTPVPAVVNLSLGGSYGAHDGTSTLEKGLTALVGDDKPGRAIVVAAGNSGAVGTAADGVVPVCTGPGWFCGSYTEVHVYPGEPVRVPIVGDAATKADGFVWIAFRPGDDISVGFEGPAGSTWVGLTAKGDQGSYESGDNRAGVFPIDDGNTVVQFTATWARGDEFAVHLRGSGDASLWISGPTDDTLFFERALRAGTINVPASAPGLLAVGCTINRVKWTPLKGAPVGSPPLGGDEDPIPDGACFFSSAGPTHTGVQKPEISAPGAFVAAAMSADADPRLNPCGMFDLTCPSNEPYCGLVDDRHAIGFGTSMSAPHVTGAVALLMELDLARQLDACKSPRAGTPSFYACRVKPTLTQARVTELLQAGARRSTGHIPDPDQLGPGSLDLEGARRVLVGAGAAPVEAAAGKSWYSLSVPYARPDTSWLVWGTVELRTGDGTVAAGLDGQKLSLSLSGGVVSQPLTRIQPGLFRFAVAGRPEDLGTTITLDVLYDGVSLGARLLPVGRDPWSAADTTVTAASGACALPPAGTRHAAGGLAFAVLAAAAALRRRRR